MENMTITDVSRNLGVSARMLRHYEKLGLIRSSRREGYAYRVYDTEAVDRLRQIILLRKLRIPLKSIGVILNDSEQTGALAVLRQSITETDDEMTALGTIRDVLRILVERLDKSIADRAHFDMLGDAELSKLVQAIVPSDNTIKERCSMEELNRAEEIINRLHDRNVRLVYLPPVTVAAVHTVSTTPEWDTLRLVRQFINESGLARLKPDFRLFGFNNDAPDCHGYEHWITIPEEMEVTAPFKKKRFEGGLYGAHMIPMGAFEEWRWLYEWAEASEEYDIDWRAPESMMGGMLEESLNIINIYDNDPENIEKQLQLDLLIPLRRKGE